MRNLKSLNFYLEKKTGSICHRRICKILRKHLNKPTKTTFVIPANFIFSLITRKIQFSSSFYGFSSLLAPQAVISHHIIAAQHTLPLEENRNHLFSLLNVDSFVVCFMSSKNSRPQDINYI